MKKSTENEEKKQTISDNRKKVLSWLEGLTFDDWHMYHSDSEVQNIAKAAFELLKRNEPRTGFWKSVPHKRARVCSVCEADEPYKFADDDADVYDFCPHCGAKMMRSR